MNETRHLPNPKDIGELLLAAAALERAQVLPPEIVQEIRNAIYQKCLPSPQTTPAADARPHEEIGEDLETALREELRRALAEKRHGKSANAFAHKAGVDRSAMVRFMEGKQDMGIHYASRLFRLLGLKVVR